MNGLQTTVKNESIKIEVLSKRLETVCDLLKQNCRKPKNIDPLTWDCINPDAVRGIAEELAAISNRLCDAYITDSTYS